MGIKLTVRRRGRAQRLSCVVGIIAMALASAAAADNKFIDPLDAAADSVLRPKDNSFLGAAQVGSRLVAVGFRGLVIISDDQGQTWRQVPVPVQSDLTSVQFIDDKTGWAAGHDGVILKTVDGGLTWTRQIDGRSAAGPFTDYYEKAIAVGNETLQPFLEQTQANFQSGPSLPYLSIHFEDARTGYAVGAFGMISYTRDGGATWLPWLEHVDNPRFLNLNEIRGIGGEIYIAGEGGMVYRLDRQHQMFAALPTGYEGSLFGIIGHADGTLITYGLRGNIYRSEDRGDHWTKVPSPDPVTIAAGTALRDGRFLLVNMNGQILLSDDDGQNFRIASSGPHVVADVTPLKSGEILVSSVQGVKSLPPE